MSNTIRIKRRATGAAGAPTSLKNGELAFNEIDQKLYYGSAADGNGDAQSIFAIGCYLGPDVAEFLGYPSTSNLADALNAAETGSVTGSGKLVLATSAILTTPDIGTPSAGDLTNCTNLPISTGVSGLGAGVATFLADPSSTNLISALTDETGTSKLVFSTSPQLTTSVTTDSTTFAVFNTTATTINAFGAATALNLGASSGTTTINNNLAITGNLTVNGTTTTVNSTTMTVDDPIVTLGGDTAPSSDDNKDRGVEFRWHNGSAAKVGFFGYDDSTGKLTFIPDATNSSEVFSGTLGTIDVGAVHINGAAFGVSNLAGLGTNVGTFLATPSSANLAAAVTDETGTGALVFANTPTLVTPDIGAATATSVNKVAITAPATSATLTIANGKTLTASNTLTFTGTDSSSVAFGAGGTVAYTSNKLSVFAATSSSELAGVISDETGSGALVFGTSPSFTTSVTTGSTTLGVFDTTATTVNAFGAATTLNLGYDGNGPYNCETNICTAPTGSSYSKTINIGTGGQASSTTNVFIGPQYLGSPVETNVSIGNNGNDNGTLAVNTYTEFNADSWFYSTAYFSSGTGIGMQYGDNSGAVTVMAPTSGSTNNTVYFPNGNGTIALTANTLGDFAATSSSALRGVISDETGTGVLVFGTSPAFTTSVTTASTTFAVFNTNATTVNAFGAATTLSVGASTGTTTINNNLTVTGNLTINGTTTTVNSTTMTVDDPIITLGGDTAPASDDNKDRGVEFRYYDSAARVGFFGWDDSESAFTVLSAATNSSEVFSGTKAPILVGTVNKVTVTQPATGSTLTIADGKTLTASNTLTFTGTDSSSVAFGAGGTVVYTNTVCTAIADCTIDGGTF